MCRRNLGNRLWGVAPHPTRDDIPQPQSTPWSLALPMLVSVDSFGFLRLSAAPSTGGPVASFTLDPFPGHRSMHFQSFFPGEATSMKRFATNKNYCKANTTPQLAIGCNTTQETQSQHSHPRAGGVPPPTGCCASGENNKTATERIHSLPCRFLFSLRPWMGCVHY